jgi:hypothetical protein
MKSQADSLLHVAEGLHKDFLLAYPALKDEFVKDFDRLRLYCRSRGLAFFTLDLPHLDSLLIQGLENGRLTLNGPLTRRVSNRVKVPRLFAGLWLRVFDKNACLKQESDVTAIFFLRSIFCLGKKLAVECTYDRIQASMRAYHDVERQLRSPTRKWDLDFVDFGEGSNRISLCESYPYRHPYRDFDLQGSLWTLQEEEEISGSYWDVGTRRLLDQVQQVADLISESLGSYFPVFYSEDLENSGKGTSFRHGPGAVAERLGSHEKSCFPNWPDKLQAVFPFHKIANTASSDVERPSNHEVASRLICVPKTAKSPRLIASEPTAHQYCQQGVRHFLVDRLRKSFLRTDFVDFHDQSKSGDLVLLASLDRKLVTVDLTDASDRLSCWTVERVFRRNPSLLTALHAARTRYVRDEISSVPGFLKPKKFASQGTAVTFPVQSIVFLSIALGVCLDGEVSKDAIRKLRGKVRVFGDDIVIPRYGYERLIRVMNSLQLKVNETKSFVNGNFRESCGVDGFKGYDVTPVKPKTLVADSPASCQAVVDTSNNLFNKGLWNASDSLRALLPARLRRAIRIVGINDAGSSGFTAFSGSYESHLAKRWNSRLHRNEVRVWTLSVQSQKRPREGWPVLLDFFTSKHNHEHARIVSSYTDTRKARSGLSWEPCSPHAQHDIGLHG